MPRRCRRRVRSPALQRQQRPQAALHTATARRRAATALRSCQSCATQTRTCCRSLWALQLPAGRSRRRRPPAWPAPHRRSRNSSSCARVVAAPTQGQRQHSSSSSSKRSQSCSSSSKRSRSCSPRGCSRQTAWRRARALPAARSRVGRRRRPHRQQVRHGQLADLSAQICNLAIFTPHPTFGRAACTLCPPQAC